MTHASWAKWGLHLVITTFFLTILLIALLKRFF